MTALHYPGWLPPGALVRQNPPTAAPTAAAAPIWLTAGAADFAWSAADPTRVTAWRAHPANGVVAQAVAANLAGTTFAPPGLRFDAEVNGGLVLSGAIADASCLTIGMIFQAGAAGARTLMALQPLRAEGSLFVDARGCDLRLAQKGGRTELPLRIEGADDQVTLLLVAVADGQAWLAANGGPAVQAGFGLALQGPADLFIGCRGPRAGLRNKLGSFALFDVLVWPGQNLLARTENQALNGAIALWHDRAAHGL